jgi:hypothetical protein
MVSDKFSEMDGPLVDLTLFFPAGFKPTSSTAGLSGGLLIGNQTMNTPPIRCAPIIHVSESQVLTQIN